MFQIQIPWLVSRPRIWTLHGPCPQHPTTMMGGLDMIVYLQIDCIVYIQLYV